LSTIPSISLRTRTSWGIHLEKDEVNKGIHLEKISNGVK